MWAVLLLLQQNRAFPLEYFRVAASHGSLSVLSVQKLVLQLMLVRLLLAKLLLSLRLLFLC